MGTRVVGLDLGASSIKAVQVMRNDDGSATVERQAAKAVPHGAVYDGRIAEHQRGAVTSVIATLFDEADFDTKDVIIGLNSSAAVFMEEMLVPLMSAEDLETALPNIIEAKNPALNSDDVEWSFSIVGEVEGDSGTQLKVLIYRVLQSYVTEMAKVVEAAGLNVVGADLASLAALRAIMVQPRPERQVDALVDIGANVMSVLVHHNGVPLQLTLDPDSAGGVATARVADALGLDDNDPKAEWHKCQDADSVGLVAQARAQYSQMLGQRVASTLRSFVTRSTEVDSIAAITLVGGGAVLAGVGHFLAKAVGENLPLSYASVDPRFRSANGLPVERQEQASGGDYLVAIGLGTGAML